MAGTKVKVTQGKSTVSPHGTNFLFYAHYGHILYVALLCPCPHGGHKTLMAVVSLFRCLVLDSKSRMEGHSELKLAGRNPMTWGYP